MNAHLESYAIEQATLRARLLAMTAGFPPHDLDDARQDLLLDYVRRSPRFDAIRGDAEGFVRGVMRHHVTVLVARRYRRVRHEVLAGDLLEPESDNTSDDALSAHRDDQTVALQISLDVRRVLGQLPLHLQLVASLLPDRSVAEICIELGKSRSRIYQILRQIRTALTEAGLEPLRGAGPRRRHPVRRPGTRR